MFDFGLRLRELREKHKLSQEQLGRRVDRSKSVISSYENNLKMPPLSILTDFAVIFNVFIKTVMAGMADMLWGVFTSANLPEYAKEQIGIRYNAIKGALEGVDRGSQEENTAV